MEISAYIKQLEDLEEYKYFERLLTSENEMTREIDERISKAWKIFGQYRFLLTDQRMPTCLKKVIIDTAMQPEIVCGAEI